MADYNILPKVLLLTALFATPISYAQTDIPILEKSKVFADFRDELPAVINFYTKQSEDDVVNFYQKAYGEPVSQQRKRGRLVLKYRHKDKNIRVIVSKQNQYQQVDIIVQ